MNDSTFLNSNTTSNYKHSADSTNKDEVKSKQLEPSKISIRNILNYSKAVSIRKSSELGFIENLLN